MCQNIHTKGPWGGSGWNNWEMCQPWRFRVGVDGTSQKHISTSQKRIHLRLYAHTPDVSAYFGPWNYTKKRAYVLHVLVFAAWVICKPCQGKWVCLSSQHH